MATPATMLEAAFRFALRGVAAEHPDPFGHTPDLMIVRDDGFWAFIEQAEGGTLRVVVADGVAAQVSTLWAGVSPGVWQRRTMDGLVWLVLHELMHARLGHFDLVDGAALTEGPPRYDLTRAKAPDVQIAERLRTARCLELQADHEAIEWTLGGYGLMSWRKARGRAESIIAMMMLIEAAEGSSPPALSAHPRAATRLFQLLGHIAEWPSLPAIARAKVMGRAAPDPADLPDEALMDRYARSMVVPLLGAAQRLAAASDAPQARTDLGDLSRFADDLVLARFADDLAAAPFITPGAREWAALHGLNQTVLARLGLEGL